MSPYAAEASSGVFSLHPRQLSSAARKLSRHRASAASCAKQQQQQQQRAASQTAAGGRRACVGVSLVLEQQLLKQQLGVVFVFSSFISHKVLIISEKVFVKR